jgi:hypothetical protein
MPYIQIRTTVSLSDEQIIKMKTELGAAISIIPGKIEQTLMMEFVPDCKLFLGGTDDEPTAFVSVAVNNEQPEDKLKEYSAKIAEVLQREAGIAEHRTYILHTSVPRWHAF